MIGGGTMKIFFQIVCGNTCSVKPLSVVEWYVVFTCLAIILAQLPNLNSIAGVSLVGAVAAISYCSLIWIVSIIQDARKWRDAKGFVPIPRTRHIKVASRASKPTRCN
ncbi:hypothetical protein CRYUN_Cryun30bG0006500 [Craigia yunnanensis]